MSLILLQYIEYQLINSGWFLDSKISMNTLIFMHYSLNTICYQNSQIILAYQYNSPIPRSVDQKISLPLNEHLICIIISFMYVTMIVAVLLTYY